MRLFTVLLAFFVLSNLGAQDCFYQLQLRDNVSGDGWNGSSVTLTVAGVPTTYTLDEMNDDGAMRDFFFPVQDGDAVRIGFDAVAFADEASFTVLDNNDEVVYEVSGPAGNVNLFSFTANCRTCAPPPLSSIELYRLRYNSVDVRFRGAPDAIDPLYRIEYGENNFDPATTDGEVVTSQDTMLRISDLEPSTTYTFWVSTICRAENDTTVRRGPFQIMTPVQKDVGVTVLRAPDSDCALGLEPVTIGITNFGGEAQQFFKVDFTVNGQPGGVVFPNDGIYTGVVGVDSTEFFTFDVMANLSVPGTYRFQAWTELEDDEDSSNDTMSFTVATYETIDEFPYLADFEEDGDGWRAGRYGRGPSSWEAGSPAGDVIDRAGAGLRAVATNLDGVYNNNERSYLSSPCFDLSGLTDDPLMSFLLYVDTEAGFDGLSLEASTDGGESWSVLDVDPSSINWYNNRVNQTWGGDGGFGENYVLAARRLTALAGEPEVRLRFVFESDGDGAREGVAIDNIRIAEVGEVDYAVVSARFPDFDFCTIPEVEITYAALGSERVDSVTLNYQIGDFPVVSERAAGRRVTGRVFTYTFTDLVERMFLTDTTQLRAWVDAEGDDVVSNDSSVFIQTLGSPLPFAEDFNDGALPRGWTGGRFTVGAGSDGRALIADLAPVADGTDNADFQTATYGVFQAGDSLRFDLGIIPDGTAGEDSLRLEVTANVDCSVGFASLLDTVVSSNGSFTVGLNELVGVSAELSFSITHLGGVFTAAFDNINVQRVCPEDFDFLIDVVNPSSTFADDATVVVDPNAGLRPFSYQWSSGDNTRTVEGLGAGTYTVTVTDAQGCTDVARVDLEFNVAVDEPGELLTGLEVFPNPTDGRLRLRLDLGTAANVSIELYDATARRLLVRDFGRTTKLNEAIELFDRPAGMYFLRVVADDAARTVRVVRK